MELISKLKLMSNNVTNKTTLQEPPSTAGNDGKTAFKSVISN